MPYAPATDDPRIAARLLPKPLRDRQTDTWTDISHAAGGSDCPAQRVDRLIVPTPCLLRSATPNGQAQGSTPFGSGDPLLTGIPL
jgi:hypothetical protein